MRLDGVGGETDQLDVSFGELWLKLCESAQLSCANWSVVFWMGEEYGPFVANPFMEIDRPCGGFCLEIGSGGPKAKSIERSHVTVLLP